MWSYRSASVSVSSLGTDDTLAQHQNGSLVSYFALRLFCAEMSATCSARFSSARAFPKEFAPFSLNVTPFLSGSPSPSLLHLLVRRR